MIDMKKTGQKIKKTCDRKGNTVKQIQQELQIGSFQSVYSWFKGKTLPSMDNFYNLCKLLHVSMESMIVEYGEFDVDKEELICLEESNKRILARLSAYVKFGFDF